MMNIRQISSVFLIGQLALLPLMLSAQSDKADYWEESCETGREEAREDIAAGKLGLYSFGHPHPDSDDDIYDNILYEDYGIQSMGGGCVATARGGCYNEVMKAHILKTLGNDVFIKARRKYEDLYASGWIYTHPQFEGDDEGALHYFYCGLPDELFVPAGERIPEMVIGLSLDKRGAVVSWSARVGYLPDDQDYLAPIDRLLDDMPNWQPAIRKGEAAAAGFPLLLKFTQEMKGRYCR